MNSNETLDDRHIRALRALAERGAHNGMPVEELIDTAASPNQRANDVELDANSRHRRRLASLAVAASVAIVGIVAVWPSDTPANVKIATDQTTVPSLPSSTAAIPTTTSLVEPEPRPPSPAGYLCLDATTSYFNRTKPNSGSGGFFEIIGPILGTDLDGLPELEFTEVVLPAGPAGRGYVFLVVGDAHILCRTSGTDVEFLDVGFQPESEVPYGEVLVMGSSAGLSEFAEFRVVGRSSQSVTSVGIVMEDGSETTAVLDGGWFVIEATDLPKDYELDERIMNGQATLRWERSDGGETSKQLFEFDGQSGPPNTTPFPAEVLESVGILQRPVTEADALPPQLIDKSTPSPGRDFAVYDAARRGADRDGVTLWVTPTEPPGGICMLINGPAIGSHSRGCSYAPNGDIPKIHTFGAQQSGSDTAYIAGVVLSDDVAEVIGATMVDDAFIFTYNPDTYDGEQHENGTPILTLLLTNGTTTTHQ